MRPLLFGVLLAAGLLAPGAALGQPVPAVDPRALAWADAILAPVDLISVREAARRPDGARLRAELKGMAGVAARLVLDEVARGAGQPIPVDPAELDAITTEVAVALDVPQVRAVLGEHRDPATAREELRPVGLAVMAVTSAALEAMFKRRQAHARLLHDEGVAASLRTGAAIYYGRNDGKYPPTREALKAAHPGGSVEFRCPGNDVDYDPRTGEIRLLITDPARC